MDIQEQLLKTPAAQHWKDVGIRHHHGINIPLFSLRSENSSGIGEFTDLIPLIDWASSLGLDVIQLLPLNDVGCDTSPYNSISAYALNPLYLSLNNLPYIDEYLELKTKINSLKSLNNSQYIDYKKVKIEKESILKLYLSHFSEAISKRNDYQTFIESCEWLKSYALFKTLKGLYQWTSWETWPNEFKSPSSDQLQRYYQDYASQITSHSIIQFLCAHQMEKVKERAIAKQVHLMGDLPILLSRDSADVWFNRDIFNLHCEAGAPPDQYSVEGQIWGFPLYKWDVLARNNYEWWVERLKFADRFYTIFRIDHVVGFYRIWAIPLGAPCKEGHHDPRNPNSWIPQGEAIMKMMLEQSTMLPIGEDLGSVPDEVRISLTRLGICGTRVMRWERKWKGDKSYLPIDEYNPISLTTVSTHDSESVSLWWHNQPEEATLLAQFKGWTYQPQISREYLHEILWDSHHTHSLFHINLLNEYLALIPGLNYSPEEERINVPGIISDKNWAYRFRPTIEELTQDHTLKHLMTELIT